MASGMLATESASKCRLSLAEQREGEAYAAADAVGEELLQQHIRVYWTCERRWFRGLCDSTCNEDGQRLHHISYQDGTEAWHHLPSECWIHTQPLARRAAGRPPLVPQAKSPLRPRQGAKSSRRTKGRRGADRGGAEPPPAANAVTEATITLLELPTELVVHVLHYLPAVELARVLAVSRAFKSTRVQQGSNRPASPSGAQERLTAARPCADGPVAAQKLTGLLLSCASPPKIPSKLNLPRLQDALGRVEQRASSHPSAAC